MAGPRIKDGLRRDSVRASNTGLARRAATVRATSSVSGCSGFSTHHGGWGSLVVHAHKRPMFHALAGTTAAIKTGMRANTKPRPREEERHRGAKTATAEAPPGPPVPRQAVDDPLYREHRQASSRDSPRAGMPARCGQTNQSGEQERMPQKKAVPWRPEDLPHGATPEEIAAHRTLRIYKPCPECHTPGYHLRGEAHEKPRCEEGAIAHSRFTSVVCAIRYRTRPVGAVGAHGRASLHPCPSRRKSCAVLVLL
jgi:hypothetical protein